MTPSSVKPSAAAAGVSGSPSRDVSAYVKPGTALDTEAHQRGNSVYFPEFVVPMLPEVLSNGLCSLNPQVDRLCMVCEMTISPPAACPATSSTKP